MVEERFAADQPSKDTVATAVKVQWPWDIPGTGPARPLGFTARDFGRYIDAPLARWRDENDDGDFLDANETLYYCQDANFNVTALVNASGTVVERYVYEPYGKPAALDADWSSDGESDYANEILCGGWSAAWTGGLCPANPAGRGSGRKNSIVSPEFLLNPRDERLRGALHHLLGRLAMMACDSSERTAGQGWSDYVSRNGIFTGFPGGFWPALPPQWQSPTIESGRGTVPTTDNP